MELEKQVTSLELSMRLKELGVKQESIFCYQDVSNSETSLFPRNFDLSEFRKASTDKRLAAYTASELLEILPKYVIGFAECKEDVYISFVTHLNKNNYCVFYGSDSYDGIVYHISPIFDESLINALAKILIHLIEQGLIKNDTL